MRVAIIGAGFSGMYAAYLLERKGIDVTVYEKEEVIGGHCRTLKIQNASLEMGTVFTFNSPIKELLIELDVEYSTRFTYRNFIDGQFLKAEHLPQDQVHQMMIELSELRFLLDQYADSFQHRSYDYVHPDLMISLYDFLKNKKLHLISELIAPHFSSFGFGSIYETQAFYAFSIFNFETITSFIRGDKLLFINQGMSHLITKLSENISDIRYNVAVTNIEKLEKEVKIESAYGSDLYDKVLITTKLPEYVIKDNFYQKMMKNIDTNPYITVAYEVKDKNIVTTYFKDHLGKKNVIQFFHTYKYPDKTIIVAYAYGYLHKELIEQMTVDLKRTGLTIKHLITAKQWYIFPHFKEECLYPELYQDISKKNESDAIHLIGSLVAKPVLSNLYSSVKKNIEELFG